MLKAVLETNVLVSALLTPNGEAAAIVQSLPNNFTLCLSEEIVAELEVVLNRTRIRHRYSLTDQGIDRYLAYLRRTGLFASLRNPLVGISRDPDDDKFFGCALAAGADCIVSRDPHILDVQNFVTPVLTPRQFLAWLRRNN